MLEKREEANSSDQSLQTILQRLRFEKAPASLAERVLAIPDGNAIHRQRSGYLLGIFPTLASAAALLLVSVLLFPATKTPVETATEESGAHTYQNQTPLLVQCKYYGLKDNHGLLSLPDNTPEHKSVRKGQMLFGAQVTEIKPNYIVLENEGKELIYLYSIHQRQ